MINLLPSKEQEKLHQYQIKRLVLVLGFIGAIFIIALSILLLTLTIRLRGTVSYQGSILEAKKGKSKTNQIKSIQGEFATYNKKVRKINQFYEDQDRPSDFLSEVNSVLPDSIRLNSLSYKKEVGGEYKAQAYFSGYCPNRDVLFKLKKKMDQKDNWKDVKFPPSNWVEPSDINFSVSFKIKNEDKK